MSLSKLKEYIREIITDELEEASTSANVPGYQTPFAFSDPKKDKKKKKKRDLGSTGYNYVSEGKYHDYRNDETLTPKQKIGKSMREIRDSLNNLDKVVKMNRRFDRTVLLAGSLTILGMCSSLGDFDSCMYYGEGAQGVLSF